MTLRIYKALETSGIHQPTVHYAWDDWRENRELRAPDKAFVSRLGTTSLRAVLAFGCGSAEWTVYRFDRLTDTALAWKFLEAAWAMIVHIRYGIGSESWTFATQKTWHGPVQSPIRKSLGYLEGAMYTIHEEIAIDPAVLVSNITKLSEYVMPDTAAYRDWSERVLQRLEALYPRDPDDPLGDPVPREAVDPDFDFNPGDAEALINRFLSGRDPQTNQFLSTPEEMGEVIEGEEEFSGTPYAFSLEEDRRTRPRA